MLNLLVLLVAQAWTTGQAWQGEPRSTDVDRPVLRRREPILPVLSVKVRRTTPVPDSLARPVEPSAAAELPGLPESSQTRPADTVPPVQPSWPAPMPAPSELEWPAGERDAGQVPDRWAPVSPRPSATSAPPSPYPAPGSPPSASVGPAMPVRPLGLPPGPEAVRLGDPADTGSTDWGASEF
ncbi:MAG: hypothetical protein U0795_10085 [Pirellulales bacterium]